MNIQHTTQSWSIINTHRAWPFAGAIRFLAPAFLALFLTVSAQAASYTNIASGNWDAPGSWANGTLPISGFDTIIVSKPTATLYSTNNMGVFILNQLLVVPAAGQVISNIATAGSSLLFTNNATVLPFITNGSINVKTCGIHSPITIATNLTLKNYTSGYLDIYGAISGEGNIIGLGSTAAGGTLRALFPALRVG